MENFFVSSKDIFTVFFSWVAGEAAEGIEIW